MAVQKNEKPKHNRKILTALIVIGVIIIGFFAARWAVQRKRVKNQAVYQTQEVIRGNLTASVRASGNLRSLQSETLYFRTSGVVADVEVKVNDFVAKNDVLVEMEQTSLPPNLIIAQANLVEAERTLDQLLNSSTQLAKALKAVEDAEQALEDAYDNNDVLADALAEIAYAQQEVDDAKLKLEILTSRPPQTAIEQAYANMLLAEKKRDDLLSEIDSVRNKLNRDPKTYMPWESKAMYRKMLNALEVALPNVQLAYEGAKNHYEDLLKPPDEIEVAVAEAELQIAQAKLADAQRVYDRLKSEGNDAEIAVLEAKLADARREYQRLKDSSPKDEVVVTEARIRALQAALEQAKVVAPFDGTITEIFIQESDRVEPATPALRIDDLSKLLIDVQVSELDINKIELGQDVVVTFDAVLAKEYHGEVVDVAMVGEQSLGEVNYEVTIEVTDADDDIKPGMSASVDIHTRTLENVLLIPNRAVRIVDDEVTIYLLQPDGNIKPVAVTLGESSDVYSELLSGEVKEGDLVVLNPPVTMFGESKGPMGGRPPFRR